MRKVEKDLLYRQKLGIGIFIMLTLAVVIGISALSYPQKMKKMFVASSVSSMESKLEDASEFTNENVEMNYEEIQLLAGLITKYLDGTNQYSESVLDIMSETKEKAGFDQVGILKLDEERPLATTSDGRKVQLNIWTFDDMPDNNEVSVDLQTSPFLSVNKGADAVVFRYVFSDDTGASYMLVAEKPQDTLSKILNMKEQSDGLTLVIRDNGNVVYGQGSIASEEMVSYNFWAYIEKLGASEKMIKAAKADMSQKEAGKFAFTVAGEPYHFVFQRIKNTKWICMNAYSETYLAGEELVTVNKETMKLVVIIAVLLLLALAFTVVYVATNIKKHGEKKIVEREKLFEEMSRYIPSAFAIVRENENEPTFVSHNFQHVLQQTLDSYSVEDFKEWAGDDLALEGTKKLNEEGSFHTIVEKKDRYYSLGVYDIGVIDKKRHYVFIIEDTTEEIESRKLLESSMRKADEASQSKTSFLSKMSHEIRTPLNSIIGFSKLALDGWTTTNQRELLDYVQKIQSAGNYLLELVSDILDISRIEEGRMKVMLMDTSLDQMVDDIVNSFTGQMQRKDLQFVVDKNYEEDLILHMDHFHTKQILNNLISNAYKYTEEGGCVGLEVSAKQINEKQVSIQYIVQDTGIGMSEEFLAKIFEPFTQDERGILMKNQLRGSGLGMSICKNLVDLLRGSIKVESEVGQGSVFTVQLIYDISQNQELQERQKQSGTQMDYASLKGKKLLVVDDIAPNRVVIEKFLEQYGLLFEEACDGQEALEKYQASEVDEYFAVLMDIQMPIMNGYKATEAIRGCDRKDASSIAIIAMTADAFSDDVNKALMSGMNYHVTKPIEIEKVLKVLMEVYENEVKRSEQK